MIITDFGEIADVMMKRNRILLKDVASHIQTSSVYARQVIDGVQQGEKADQYRVKIAIFLGIDEKYTNSKRVS